MNREIKFRAWDKTLKKMSPVASIGFGDDGSALTILFETAPKGHYYEPLVADDSAVLMQFTGLKDKNGREIYEGDLIKSHIGGLADPEDVLGIKYSGSLFAIYNPSCCPACREGFGYISPLDEWNPKLLEVIGNIYESPDLVKGAHAA